MPSQQLLNYVGLDPQQRELNSTQVGQAPAKNGWHFKSRKRSTLSNYGELKSTGCDTSINVFTNVSLQWQSRTIERSATRYFHDKKYTAYYCFSATRPFSTNNSILNSCVKWAVFSEPVTYYVNAISPFLLFLFVQATNKSFCFILTAHQPILREWRVLWNKDQHWESLWPSFLIASIEPLLGTR